MVKVAASEGKAQDDWLAADDANIDLNDERSLPPEGDALPYACRSKPLDRLRRPREAQRQDVVCVEGKPRHSKYLPPVRQDAVADEFLLAGLDGHFKRRTVQLVEKREKEPPTLGAEHLVVHEVAPLDLVRVVVADERAPRDGRFIDEIGYYDPMTKPSTIKIEKEKALDWMQKGAQPTDSARSLLKRAGVLEK